MVPRNGQIGRDGRRGAGSVRRATAGGRSPAPLADRLQLGRERGLAEWVGQVVEQGLVLVPEVAQRAHASV